MTRGSPETIVQQEYDRQARTGGTQYFAKVAHGWGRSSQLEKAIYIAVSNGSNFGEIKKLQLYRVSGDIMVDDWTGDLSWEDKPANGLECLSIWRWNRKTCEACDGEGFGDPDEYVPFSDAHEYDDEDPPQCEACSGRGEFIMGEPWTEVHERLIRPDATDAQIEKTMANHRDNYVTETAT